MTRILTAVCLSLILALPLAAEDWPQWLAPQRDGTPPRTVAPPAGAEKPPTPIGALVAGVSEKVAAPRHEIL